MWFWVWAVTGAFFFLAAFDALATGPGVFLLPLAAVSLVLVGWRGRRWPEALGVIAGVGALALLVAYSNRHSRPCTGGTTVILGPESPSGMTGYSCGGVSPEPWLLGGMFLVTAGVLSYLLLQRFARRHTRVSVLTAG